jgi:hypothetical protein
VTSEGETTPSGESGFVTGQESRQIEELGVEITPPSEEKGRESEVQSVDAEMEKGIRG